MSWIQNLAETYDNCQSNIGYANDENQRPLLPICHITTQAHVEIVIDGDGKFRRARVIIEKSDSTTIIPSTEGSGSRAGSKPENHPLCDKLQYVAGDYTKYGGVVTSGFSKNPVEPFNNFVGILTKWCESEFSHPKACAVLKYVIKKTVVRDLVQHQMFFLGANKKFTSKEDVKREKNAKDIFSAIDSQEDTFIRWIVEIPKEKESRVWRDQSLWESWIEYYLSDRKEKSFCYVTGENQVLTSNHPKYIRREGDGAKLISANDKNGFTFRGRFIDSGQACGVGLDVSHKSHYALSWLISRQGYKKNEVAIVAWAISGIPIPQPTDDPPSLLWGNAPTEEDTNAYTAQELGIKLRNKIAGYGKELGKTDKVVVMALDSATTGRMAITYYRDLAGSDFLQKIDEWHATCQWLHRYGEALDKESGKTRKNIPFVGAPAPADIAEAAYGSRLDDKLRKATIARLLPCIVDGQPIPRDLVESVIRRASNRAGIKNPDDKKYRGDDEYTWKKTLSIACALFKKFKQGKEKYEMALDPNRKTRDYLYGRLLALADSLEEWALNEAKENRSTNAARLMQRFAERPYSTWRTIELALTPYKARLGGKSKKRQRMIDEVVAAFEHGDFTKDKRLSGEFLLGYHCQREFLRPGNAEDSDSGDGIANTTNNANQ
jgi:CRISPR-associated protein Csd1